VSSTLAAIVAATLVSGAASVLIAAWLSLSLLAAVVQRLVSLSAGLLLGSAILNLLPEAFESGADLHSLSWVLLASIIAFFTLENFAVLRHSHHHEHDGHGHRHGHDREEAGPAGLVVLVGDTIHNTADGVMIAAAFLVDPALGWITTAAIAAHEIPQEIGDFIVLINAGYTRRRALVYNLLSGVAAVIGGIVGYFALEHGRALLPYVLVVAAASFVYVALADLIPGLHRETRRGGEWFWQFALMLGGVSLIALSAALLDAH